MPEHVELQLLHVWLSSCSSLLDAVHQRLGQVEHGGAHAHGVADGYGTAMSRHSLAQQRRTHAYEAPSAQEQVLHTQQREG